MDEIMRERSMMRLSKLISSAEKKLANAVDCGDASAASDIAFLLSDLRWTRDAIRDYPRSDWEAKQKSRAEGSRIMLEGGRAAALADHMMRVKGEHHEDL